MSEFVKILLTSGLTIVGGVTIFVIGQLLAKFFIEPIYEQHKAIGIIANDLIFYARLYVNPGTTEDRPIGTVYILPEKIGAEETLRQHASKLMALTQAIPCYWLWERLGLVRSKSNIVKAHQELIYLSNSIVQGSPEENKRSRGNITEALGFRDLFPRAEEGA